MWYRNLISSTYARTLLIVMCLIAPQFGLAQANVGSALRGILRPASSAVQYNYVMTASIRLLLFWVGADDVGGGYIRRSTSADNPTLQMVEVLFGSDPAKAPRRINHWGAAIEAHDGRSTTMLGFMKSANTGSASDAEAEIRRQSEDGEHRFEALLNVADVESSVARKAILTTRTDLTLHHLAEAQQLAVFRLQGEGKVRELRAPGLKCVNGRGFLHTIDNLTSAALKGGAGPVSECYTHNARTYIATLTQARYVPSRTIEFERRKGGKVSKTYTNLMELEFSTLNQSSGERTEFEMLVGTTGNLEGVPLQIVHQPNWWFKVVLNLDDIVRRNP